MSFSNPPWVRVIDGVLTLCWYEAGTPAQQRRPLTFAERLAWRLLARTPWP